MLASVSSGFAFKQETLQDLIQQAESAKPEDQPKLYVRVAERQLKSADKLYSAGSTEDARTAVGDTVMYSGKATEAAIGERKKMKDVEIAVRKMADRLRDIKRTLNFEDQAPVQQAIEKMETMRTRLLSAMFSK